VSIRSALRALRPEEVSRLTFDGLEELVVPDKLEDVRGQLRQVVLVVLGEAERVASMFDVFRLLTDEVRELAAGWREMGWIAPKAAALPDDKLAERVKDTLRVPFAVLCGSSEDPAARRQVLFVPAAGLGYAAFDGIDLVWRLPDGTFRPAQTDPTLLPLLERARSAARARDTAQQPGTPREVVDRILQQKEPESAAQLSCSGSGSPAIHLGPRWNTRCGAPARRRRRLHLRWRAVVYLGEIAARGAMQDPGAAHELIGRAARDARAFSRRTRPAWRSSATGWRSAPSSGRRSAPGPTRGSSARPASPGRWRAPRSSTECGARRRLRGRRSGLRRRFGQARSRVGGDRARSRVARRDPRRSGGATIAVDGGKGLLLERLQAAPRRLGAGPGRARGMRGVAAAGLKRKIPRGSEAHEANHSRCRSLSGAFAATQCSTSRPAARDTAAPMCRCTPQEQCWPEPAEWQRLAASLHGKLEQPRSPLEPCRTDAAGQACAAAIRNSKNPFFLQEQPGGTESAGWLGGWSAAASAYAVAAEDANDVAAAVDFARRHRLRLVIKRTGHDYLGRSSAPDSLLVWTHRMRRVSVHDAFTPRGCPAGQAGTPARVGGSRHPMAGGVPGGDR